MKFEIKSCTQILGFKTMEEINVGGKGDICKTCNNKDKFKKRQKDHGRTNSSQWPSLSMKMGSWVYGEPAAISLIAYKSDPTSDGQYQCWLLSPDQGDNTKSIMSFEEW